MDEAPLFSETLNSAFDAADDRDLGLHGAGRADLHALETGGAEGGSLVGGDHRVDDGAESAVVQADERLADDLVAGAVAEAAEHALVRVVADGIGHFDDGTGVVSFSKTDEIWNRVVHDVAEFACSFTLGPVLSVCTDVEIVFINSAG